MVRSILEVKWIPGESMPSPPRGVIAGDEMGGRAEAGTTSPRRNVKHLLLPERPPVPALFRTPIN